MNAISVSILLGMLTVLQAGLNRQITSKWGLSTAILINSVLLLLLTFILWMWNGRTNADLSGFKWQWWYAVPALCGLAILTGIPWSLAQIGALRVFLCLVVGQMVLSMTWDIYVENIAIDVYRVAGALLAVGGVVIANWRS